MLGPTMRDALGDHDSRADAHGSLDTRVRGNRRGGIDAVRRRVRNTHDAANDVVARATVLAGRADVRPIRPARFEPVKRLARALQRRKDLIAEIVELVCRDVLEDLRARKRRRRCWRAC